VPRDASALRDTHADVLVLLLACVRGWRLAEHLRPEVVRVHVKRRLAVERLKRGGGKERLARRRSLALEAGRARGRRDGAPLEDRVD